MNRLGLFLCAFFLALSALAQSPVTGFPPYGSFQDGQFDAVNRQNLNVNFAVPIVSSHGRGMDLAFAIRYDSLIYQKIGNAWFPVSDANGNPTWGWKRDSVTGSIPYSWYADFCITYDSSGFPVYNPYTVYSGYAYVDAKGTSHPFDGTFVTNTTAQCLDDSGSRKVYARDGSEYFLDATSPSFPIVTSRDGTKISTSGTLTDTNGNFVSKVVVSSTETDWKDTVGRIALKIQQLTGTANCGTNIPQCTKYIYSDSNGADRTIQLNFQSFSIKTSFLCPGVADYTSPAAVSLPTQISLPNNQSFQFAYEDTPGAAGYKTGRLQQVTLPTGGYYNYGYPSATPYGINCADGTVTSLTRVINDGTTSSTWQFTRDLTNSKTKVTAPAMPYDKDASQNLISNETIFTFNGTQETSRQIYQGKSDGTGTLLRTINTSWSGVTPLIYVTILEDNSQSQTDTILDAYGNLQLLRERDWGAGTPGPLIRTTTFTYLATSPYTSRNIVNRLTNKTIYQGDNITGTIQSSIDVVYDGSTPTSCPTGIPQHDDFNYGCTFNTRGNQTSVKTYTDPANLATAITKNFTYDFFGNLLTADVDCCQQKKWIYSATTQYAYPDSVVSGPSTGTQLTTSTTYNSYTGLVATATDENGKQTTYSYDTLRRLTTLQRPDGAQIIYSYNDAAPPLQSSSTVTSPIQGTNTRKQTTVVDGLGRPVKTTIQDASLNSYSIVETQYDPLGRPYKVSNPHNSTAQYWTETRFDALGRTSKVIAPAPDSSQTTYAYAGTTVTVTDPTGKQRKSDYDALGRLVNVYEPDVTSSANPLPLTQQTSYSYTVLDALATVTQGVQTRTYNYDGLSRLTSAATPETNNQAVSYQYNNFSLVTLRTDPRGVQINYQYDLLNRLLGMSYTILSGSGVAPMPNVCTPAPAGAQPANVCFFYDEGGATAFALGRRTRMVDSTGSEAYTYDQLGRITQVQKAIGGTTYTLGYAYNLASELTSITYPSNRQVQQSYDSIGRLSTISSGTTSYASGFSYSPAGQVISFNYGNGVYTSFGYSPDRLQLQCLDYSTQNRNGQCQHDQTSLFGLTYGYTQNGGNNGQITSITDSVDAGRNVNYTYDALYRLKTAVTSGSANYPQWGLSWTYDRYGNRLNQSQTAGSPPMNSLSFANPGGALTNRPDNYAHDANGNMTADGLNSLVYDGENRITSAPSTTYSYDGNGLRVQKVSGTTTTAYVFSGVKVIAEYVGSSLSKEYIYSGTQLIATYDGGTLKYHHADYLSVRVSTDATGSKIGEQGHYPFGEVWYATSGTTKWQFTTYERDTETGNDYALARYHVNRLGRFASPDPLSGDVYNPQRLNRYAYALNSPISTTDPSGLDGNGNPALFVAMIEGFTVTDSDVGGGDPNPFSAAFSGSLSGPQLTWLYQDGSTRQFFGSRYWDLPGNGASVEEALERHYAWVAQALAQSSSDPHVDQGVLGDCTRERFGVSLVSFGESRPGSNGSFVGYGPDSINNGGNNALIRVTNDASSYNSAQLSAQYAASTGRPLPPHTYLTGLTWPDRPYTNYTNNNNTPMGTISSQVHELGHSLRNITTGFTRPGQETSNAEFGRLLEDCVRSRAGFRR